MKKFFSIACLAISTALIAVLMTTSLVFAEGEEPDIPADESAASGEALEDSSEGDGAVDDSVDETPPEEESTQGTDETSDESVGETGDEPVDPSQDEHADDSTLQEDVNSEPGGEEQDADEAAQDEAQSQEEQPDAEAGQSADDSSSAQETDEQTAQPPSEESEEEAVEEIVLTDEDGNELDMASQDSADAVAAGDPWWISGGVKYAVVFNSADCPSGTSYGSTCWADTRPIEYALSIIDTNGYVPSDGKLYVEAGVYSDNVVIDGSSGNGYLSSLTGLIGSSSGLVTLNGSISISNTLSGFTLSGFSVYGEVTLNNNAGDLNLSDLYIENSSGDGLTVDNQNGNVTITNMQSRNNKGDGAVIDNTASLKGSIIITNSSFDYNDDENDSTWNVGLSINTNGVVSLNGVAASRNNGNGAVISGFSSLTISNALFDHNYVDPFNSATPYGYGLKASTTNAATVRLDNVYAYYNDNTAIDIVTAGSVYLTNVRASHTSVRVGEISSGGETVYERLNEDNKYTGDQWYFSGINGQALEILLESDMFDAYLELYDAGTDTLLDANDNLDGTTTNAQINYTLSADGTYYILVKTLESSGSSDGDYTLSVNDSSHLNQTTYDYPGSRIDTTSGYGSVFITNAMFQDNVGDGLVIDTLRKVTFNSIDASYNSGNGLTLDNCQYDSFLGICLGSGNITFISPTSAGWYSANYFLGNSGTGLDITTSSRVIMYNTSAYDNLGNGVKIYNAYTSSPVYIKVTLPNFTNVFRNNGLTGVWININGLILIYDTEADLNDGNGFQLSTLSAVTLSNVSASGNGGTGLLIDNSSSRSTISVKNRPAQGEYSENGLNGIDITSLGSILLYNIIADDNSGSGMVLDTCVSTGSVCLGVGKVVVNSYYSLVNTFDGNGEYGLNITSAGNVSLTFVTASENGDTGLNIDTTLSSASITIRNPIRTGTAAYSYNGGDGINISTNGNISIFNVTASSNTGSGMMLDNCQFGSGECIGFGKVTMKGLYGQVNEFNSNHDYGVYIESGGAVTLINIHADQNGYNGLYVNNSLELAIQSVKIYGTRGVTNTFNYNGSNEQGTYPGLEIHSFGYIYLNTAEAKNNYAAGAYLYNKDALIKPASIKIQEADFSQNQGSGLIVYSNGKVYLGGVVSSYNSLIYSDIVLTGETVYERLTAISTYDTWWFEITESTTVTDFAIILESTEFDGYLEIYDGDGNLLASDSNSYSEYDAEIDINLTELGMYYIRVMTEDSNHGNYTLSINDETHLYNTYFNFYGALIDNTAGVLPVTVTKGKINVYNEFKDNNYRGIEIDSNSSISAYNVVGTDNGDTGAYYDNHTGYGKVTVKMLVKGEAAEYDSNSEWGLYVASHGTVTLFNISASENGSAGAFVNNCDYNGSICLGSGSVYIKAAGNINEFNNNQLYGLYVASSGNVTLYDVEADGNGYSGLYVKNQYANVNGKVLLKTSRNHTNSFSGNGWLDPLDKYGFEVYSNNVITMYAGNVIGNYGGGAVLLNQTSAASPNIYLYETSFEANQGNGIWAESKGLIYLSGVESRYNSVNSGEIDYYGETIYEHLTPYYESDTWWFDGVAGETVDIILESDEFDVLLQVFDKDGNLIAVDDDSYGGTDAQLNFELPLSSNYYIRVSANNSGEGNYVLTLNDAAHDWTTMYRFDGAYLNNSYGSGDVLVSNSKLNDDPSFYHNNHTGLEIISAGNVTLTSVSAMQNGEDGVNIDNTAGFGKVSIYTKSKTSTSSYSYNTKYGVYILSNNAVTVLNKRSRMYLRDNGYSGAYIDNTGGLAGSVSFSGAEVNQNGMKGLEIYSSGSVAVYDILAVNNGTNGVYIQNNSGAGSVSVLGSKERSNISDNGATGLAVYSNGSITVNRINAIQNGGRGMILSNSSGVGQVRLTDSISRLNARHGLQINSGGLVYMKNVQSMSNGEGNNDDGLYIEISDPAFLQLYFATFLGNEGNGIELVSDTLGSPLLSSVTYFGNDTDNSGDLNYYAHLS